MTTDLVRHTARAVDLSTLVFVTGAAAAIIAGVAMIDHAAVAPTAQACSGALAAAAAIALRDPARELLAAAPMSPRLRMLQRSALIVPATLVASTLLGVLAHRSIGGPVVELFGLESLLALVVAGFATTACCARRWPDTAAGAGAALALAWATVPMFAPGSGTWWWTLWASHPWVVIVAAAAITWRASAN